MYNKSYVSIKARTTSIRKRECVIIGHACIKRNYIYFMKQLARIQQPSFNFLCRTLELIKWARARRPGRCAQISWLSASASMHQ